jgi:hypothetical protein
MEPPRDGRRNGDNEPTESVVENIPHLDDVSRKGVNHSDHTLRLPSLPRRDGQGRRRGPASALVLALGLLCACSGILPEPVDHAESSPPTHTAFPPRTRSVSEQAPPEPFVAGTFDLDVVDEASGLALSVRNRGTVYVLDDGPGSTGVQAVETATGTVTTVTVEGLDGRDTEGLAVGPCGGRASADSRRARRPTCLFIGDIGNNQGAWPSVRVWRVREPDLPSGPASNDRPELRVTGDVATYTYPGAPIDAEALLVDAGRPYLITKERPDPDTGRAPRPRLLGARRFADGRLRDLGVLRLPEPQAGGLMGAVLGNVVTGAELAGGRVVLRTYDHVLVYTPHTDGAPLRTLRRWRPREVATPQLRQGEGVAMDACGIWLISEGVQSIWLVPQAAATVTDDMQEEACPNGSGRS